MRRQSQTGRKSLAKVTCDKGLTKNVQRTQNSTIRKWTRLKI